MIRFVIEQLTGALPLISDIAKDRRDLADNALESISRALTETNLYVSRYNKTKQKELETQEELARLWASAAIPLRHIDKNLSTICELKSNYWVDPENWNEEDANGIEIDLETVREKYLAKLN